MLSRIVDRRGQILPVFRVISYSIVQKMAESGPIRDYL